mmetsp:Transcript_806/g.3368  ORF Transcript_806/g.3368 Transcript_806/m.3368 type:complete len:304 (+) Transcript_806:2752-3663(+)
MLQNDAPVQPFFGRHETVDVDVAFQTFRHQLDVFAHVHRLDATDGDEFLERELGFGFVGLDVERGEEFHDVALECFEPSLEHLDARASNHGCAIIQTSTQNQGTMRDRHRLDGHLGRERQKCDATNVLRHVPRAFYNARNRVIRDRERAQNRLSHLFVLFASEQLHERLRDVILREILRLPSVLQTTQRSRRLRPHRRHLIPNPLQHHVRHAFIQLIAHLSVGTESIQHTRDDLTRAESHRLVLRSVQVEQKSQKRLVELIRVFLHSFLAPRAKGDDKSYDTFGAHVSLVLEQNRQDCVTKRR